MSNEPGKDIAVYQAKDGSIELRVDVADETIWASQAQLADIFDIDQSGVARHIKNILADNEVDEKSNMQKVHIAMSDKPVSVYSLDVILAVGYRANSSKAIGFRKWATKTLKSYITSGYSINPSRIRANYNEFLVAVGHIKSLASGVEGIDSVSTLALIETFTATWLSLDAYDKSRLPIKGISKETVNITTVQLAGAINELKSNLLAKGQATELFASPIHGDGLESIMGNVHQFFGDQELYPTIEDKAAHLLYFIVKNHIFSDGNKRSGAFAFIWYLREAGVLGSSNISPDVLTTLTLLIAESEPRQKTQVVGLVLLLLGVPTVSD